MRMFVVLLIAFALLAASVVADEKTEVVKPKAEKVEKIEKAEDPTGAKKAEVIQKAEEAEATEEAEALEMFTTESGVRYQDLVVGKGVKAAYGMRAECHYTLWFADSTGLVKGKRFQSSKDRGKTFTCTVGQRLIKGWSDGMVGMKEGGTRLLYVPWQLGYGEKGRPPLPGKQNLIFEIEFVRQVK